LDAVRLFAEIIAQRHTVGASSYAIHPEFLALIECGFIAENGVFSSLLCDDCASPHEAKVEFEGGRYGYHCPEFGFVPKERHELRSTEPDLDLFVEQIADHLGCKHRKTSPVSENVWRIGTVEAATANISLYFQPTLHSAQDVLDFERALLREVKPVHGIVMTATGKLAIPPLATIELRDCLSFDTATCRFAVDADLGAIAGIPPTRSGGRPSEYDDILIPLIQSRKVSGRAKAGRNEEAKAVLQEFKSLHPDKNAPALSTVKTKITAHKGGS